MALSPRVWDAVFRHDLNRQVGINHRLPKFDQGLWFDHRDPEQSKKSEALFPPSFLPTIDVASKEVLPYVRKKRDEEGKFSFFVLKSLAKSMCKEIHCDGVFEIESSNKDFRVHLNKR